MWPGLAVSRAFGDLVAKKAGVIAEPEVKDVKISPADFVLIIASDGGIVCDAVWCTVLQRVAVCCSALQCVAVCCSVLQCVAVCCSVLQCVCGVFALCYSVLQCVAVCDMTHSYVT